MTAIPGSQSDVESEATVDRPGGDSATESRDSVVRVFGDYDLLEEIARGGMGVVYRARQRSLNRVVAVKMILAGQLARDEEVQRFYNEAEVAANLQHPNIVAIHEVGKIDDQHFFSMDYVDGPSLSDLVNQGPLTPDRSALLLKQIAEAIEYAHHNGTLHRDLKPQNVLIDQNGQPHVTDFGLARKLDSGSSLTTTGQILGTPSYMPPEQAAGRTSDIGPASDVYSLGSILFVLLTGRPPFQSDSTVETLRDVLESDPPLPRMLNAAVPHDLETICLKCLEKEPTRRYESAALLADDLGLFLQGEPIQARPLGIAGRLVRWARRKPALAVVGISNLVFYTFHLFAMLVLKIPGESGFFHWFLTGVVVSWVTLATLLQREMDGGRWKVAADHSYMLLVVVAITSIFTVDKGPSSAPIMFYFLAVVGASLLTARPALVWSTTAMSVAGFLWLIAYARFYEPQHSVPIDYTIAFVFNLVMMGVIMHLLIRRARIAEARQSGQSTQ